VSVALALDIMACNNYDNLHIGDKPSSRVLAPPGGKSNIFFNDDTDAVRPRTAACQAARNKSQFSLAAKSPQASAKPSATAVQRHASHFSLAPASPVQGPRASECQQARTKSSVFAARSPLKTANIPHSSAMSKFDHNATSVEAVSVAKPSTRVLNPPGGRSNNIFG
jgi:hypothetical protein